MGNIKSKQNNARLLRQDPQLRNHLPHMLPLTKTNLSSMLQKYHFVYLKPDNSCQGKGLFRVDRYSPHLFSLRSRDDVRPRHYHSLRRLYKNFLKHKMPRRYLIQRGIRSQTPSGQMVDIRVHLARIHGKWVTAGIVGRVAPLHRIATNAYSGGKSVHVYPLLTKKLGYNRKKAFHTMAQMIALSRRAVSVISPRYPRWAEYGLDIGIDANGHLWIYEINIKPGGLVFKNLSAKAYKRILLLHRLAR
ncbi:YheC/YheD family protein [Laceyella putida]|uniref:YheC/YheD family protein n=1 Tax=Laceyella putida TaxID=110101 RepID=A0ABW2RNX3_9BACL